MTSFEYCWFCAKELRTGEQKASCCLWSQHHVAMRYTSEALTNLPCYRPASMAVKKQRQFVSSISDFHLFCYFFPSAFSSLNLQVKMATEERWKSSASKQHSGAEQAGEKESCVLLSQQLGEPERFTYAALCGVSLAWLFPEKEQRY